MIKQEFLGGKIVVYNAEIRTIEEAREVYSLCKTIKNVEDCR